MEMDRDLDFLDFAGLADDQKEELLAYIKPSSKNPWVELPWDGKISGMKESPLPDSENCELSKEKSTALNVHAPSFHSKNIQLYDWGKNTELYSWKQKSVALKPPCHKSNLKPHQSSNDVLVPVLPVTECDLSPNKKKQVDQLEVDVTINKCNSKYENSNEQCCLPQIFSTVPIPVTVNSEAVTKQLNAECVASSLATHPIAPFPSMKPIPGSCHMVSKYIPGFTSIQPSTGVMKCEIVDLSTVSTILQINNDNTNINTTSTAYTHDNKTDVILPKTITDVNNEISGESLYCPYADPNFDFSKSKNVKCPRTHGIQPMAVRSFADVLKAKKTDETTLKSCPVGKMNVIMKLGDAENSTFSSYSDRAKANIVKDRLAIEIGRYLYKLELDFSPVYVTPRGLINNRNWCYINATLQALVACPPFYRLMRDFPPGHSRGLSSTPVIDSMRIVASTFMEAQLPQDDVKPGSPFQPITVYEMLGAMKSDCLKGQQEDAEEFLSLLLNGMHEEMVSIIKNYEKKHNLSRNEETKSNGHQDEDTGDSEWQVIGAKQRGMITRKVVEHKTPISDLLGGQIKSFLTTNGKTSTSASVQPFFTLQLDIQAENVTSLEEALYQMTIKEPIQGYTCAKSKQEVEAFSKILLQKLPPILILHLKRFVYDKNGGCKKVMKHTEYPIMLELKKDLFSPEAKKETKLSLYKLFAVMYHNGEEAIKGHYISDVYNHGSQSWIRCDDRNITPITEAQVLSHSPPRVPYLLFYQVVSKSI